MNNERLAHVRANLRRHGLSQMLLVDPLSIWWLCGYYTEPYEYTAEWSGSTVSEAVLKGVDNVPTTDRKSVV